MAENAENIDASDSYASCKSWFHYGQNNMANNLHMIL